MFPSHVLMAKPLPLMLIDLDDEDPGRICPNHQHLPGLESGVALALYYLGDSVVRQCILGINTAMMDDVHGELADKQQQRGPAEPHKGILQQQPTPEPLHKEDGYLGYQTPSAI
jgi:hypothetical protein